LSQGSGFGSTNLGGEQVQQAGVFGLVVPLLARLAATRIGARVLTGIGLGSLLVSGPSGVALRSTLERAAAAGGPTIQALTRLTQAPQVGRALSTAVGQNANALAQAARAEGQLFSAQIPQALVSELSSIGLATQRVTQMGNVVGSELRFLPGASQFVAPFFQAAP
jgi:hypothetical protein